MGVGRAIGEIHHLSLKERSTAFDEGLEVGRLTLCAMLEDGRPQLESQIEPRKIGVGTLDEVHGPKPLAVVFEAPILGHEPVQDLFARMTEGRVPQVVGQGQRFNESLVQSERIGYRPCDLSHL